VTGAARDIGRRVTLALAKRSYAVAANDLVAPEETLEELKRASAKTPPVPGDVSDEEVVRGMVGAVIGELGRVDVLVNNAGVSLIAPVEETALADWRRVLEVNPRVETTTGSWGWCSSWPVRVRKMAWVVATAPK
jgi:NAD(P)-dependent dehydrogenase (short-subunit alcohol dehydrogenase family)